MKIIKKIIGMLIVAVVLGPSGTGFAQTEDCDIAKATCNKTCDAKDLHDYQSGAAVDGAQFKERCHNACDQASGVCRELSTPVGCEGYFYHCRSLCPVTDAGDKTFAGTDAFFQCESACSSGKTQCEKAVKDLPVTRERETTLNACDESHSACAAECALDVNTDDRGSQAQSSFYQTCLNACRAGLDACSRWKVNSLATCPDFEFNCLDHCPGVEMDDEQGVFVDKSEEGEYCMDACEAGRDYCGGILYVKLGVK